MIEAINLTKRFGRTTAIDNLSFSIEAGEIVGFLGPNGAGKTTTLRILSCFMPATGGSARVAGHDVFRDALAVRRRIGYLPENAPLYPDMRVIEYLRYRGHLKGMRGRDLRRRLGETIESCGLGDARRRLIGRLSKGYRQRVGLADALLHEPEVLILDEPTIGLDPNQMRQVRDLIVGLGKQQTVLLSSHILSEIESVCDRVLIINRGRIVASDTPGKLVSLLKGNVRVAAEIKGPVEEVRESLRGIEGMLNVSVTADREWPCFRCESTSATDARGEIFRLVSRKGWVLRELHSQRRGLEDVFAAITREDGKTQIELRDADAASRDGGAGVGEGASHA